MLHTFARRAAVVLAIISIVATAGCTVHNKEVPGVTGPSTFATSVTLNAIPDAISQDGGSQSSVRVLVIGSDGKGISGVPLRVDMAVNGVAQDFGTLSARTIVTNTDGVATVVYTAPASPPNGLFGTCAGLPGTCVEIVATPTGTNFQTSVSQSVRIRLVPPGIILPPAGTPTAAFTLSPSPAFMNVPVTFDASSSAPGLGATQITSYAWTFGDGGSGTGRTVTHTFTAQQSFSVTLTIVNDRGLSATTTVPVAVSTVTAPSPKFVFSPSSPQVGQTVVFNADQSTSAAGHTLTAFSWNFGDGGTGSGVTVSHVFTTAGAFNVVLSVLDDTGQKGTTSVTVTAVTAGVAGSAPTATFTSSPTNPGVGESVFFNAATSTAGTGHTIASYAWTFGDGGTGSGVTVTHVYTVAGTYSAQLKVTDEIGQSATSAATTIPVGNPPSPSANFTFSPTTPGRNEQVVFDASSSTTPQGVTIVDVAWNYGDGTAVVHCGTLFGNDPSCVNPGVTNRVSAHAFAIATSFVVNLVVTDSAGRTGSHNATVNVSLAEPAVVIGSSPGAPTQGTAVQFDSSGTRFFGGSTAASYAWTFGDATGSALANPSHTYAVAGTYSVRLSVTDSLGRTGTATKDIVVASGNPTAVLTLTKAGGNTVNGDGGGSTAVGGATITSYTFVWGDGTTSGPGAASTASRTYLVAGTFTVRLNIVDSVGRTGTTTQSVTVP